MISDGSLEMWGRNGEQWVNLNVDEISRQPGLQPEALCTTGVNVCLGPALPTAPSMSHLPTQGFVDFVPFA